MSITIQDLSKEEEIVLEVVQEYLNKNRKFNIGKVLPFIHSRFKLASIDINEVGIKKNLKSLIEKKHIIEGSKLTRENVLDNKIRGIIYDHIKNSTGTYHSKIMKKLQINNYLVVWHVGVLEKFGLIRRELFDNRYIYFDSNIDFNKVKIGYLISKEKANNILSYLHTNNTGVSKTQISRDLSMHLDTVTKYLTALIAQKLVIQETIENRLLYFINLEIQEI